MSIDRTPASQTFLKGRKFGLGTKNELQVNGIELTSPAVDATVTVGTESTDVRNVTITLKDANGVAIDFAEIVDVFVFKGDKSDIAATGGSTGLAIDSAGKILTTVTAKKRFTVMSSTAGSITMTWTDTGTESVNIGVRLPNGRFVFSGSFANA